jgi:hypothetical protein
MSKGARLARRLAPTDHSGAAHTGKTMSRGGPRSAVRSCEPYELAPVVADRLLSGWTVPSTSLRTGGWGLTSCNLPIGIERSSTVRWSCPGRLVVPLVIPPNATQPVGSALAGRPI